MAKTITHVLPADAKNPRVVKSVIEDVAVDSKKISDSSSEGPVYQAVYEPRLVITVKYDSKSLVDVSVTGSGNDGQYLPGDDLTPTLTFIVKVADSKLGKVPASLVKLAPLSVASITLDDPNYQYKCQYDNDYNTKIDPNCKETPTKVVQTRPVLKLEIDAE